MKAIIPYPLVLLFCWTSVNGQSIEMLLGDTGRDQISHITPGMDGSFWATGSKTVGDEQQIWLLKLSPDGTILWEKTIPSPTPNTHAFGLRGTLLPDGGLVISGKQRTTSTSSASTGIAIRTDATGKVVWKKVFPDTDAVFDALLDGPQFFLVGSDGVTGFLLRIDSNGTHLKNETFFLDNPTAIRRIFRTPDGNLLLVGRFYTIGAGPSGVFLLKVEPNGNQIWHRTVDTDWRENSNFSNDNFYNQSLGAVMMGDGSCWVVNPEGPQLDVTLMEFSSYGTLINKRNYGLLSSQERPFDLTSLPDGGWLIVGEARTYTTAGYAYQGFAMRIDSLGYEQWKSYNGDTDSEDRFLSCATLDSGQFILAGMSNKASGHGDMDGWLLRTEPDGNTLPWNISGRIVLDQNHNCISDADEPGVTGWFIEAVDSMTRLIISDSMGQFSFRTGDGVSKLKALAPESPDIWQFCDNEFTIVSNTSTPDTFVTFLVQSTEENCPHTEVSITQPDLVRCDTSTFVVTIQNRGAGPSAPLVLSLITDQELSVVSASEPFFVSGNDIEFDIDPLGIYEQVFIEVRAKLACDVQIGATHLMVARLMPLECEQDWTGPRFSVSGHCSGNEILVSMQNEGGGGPDATTRYRVISDDLLQTVWTEVLLPEGGQGTSLNLPADGHTWRVEIEQTTGYPGGSYTGVSIEGCGRTNNGLHSIGFRNAFPSDDSRPDLAAIMIPNTTGVPSKMSEVMKGFGSYNFISKTGWVEFSARVQNPLSTLATSAEFRFMFSPNLDLTSFQVTASNGPVELSVDPSHTLKVTMKNLLLVPGATAMIRFRIRLLDDTPPDSGVASNLRADAVAYMNGRGPLPLITGFYNYSLSFPNTTDSYNVYPEGMLRFGGRNYEFATTMSSGMDRSVLLGGISSSYSDRSQYDGFVVKTDTLGVANWLSAVDLGDQANNTIEGVAPTPEGGCFAAGNWLPPPMYEGSLSDYTPYVVCFDSLGQQLWSQKFRPAGPKFGALVNGLIPTPDGDAILFGYTENEEGVDQFYLKVNSKGDVLWLKHEPVIGSAFRPFTGMSLPDGGYVFLGTNVSTVLNFRIFFEKIDAEGNLVWGKGYNSSKSFSNGGMARTPDNGFLYAGSSTWKLPSGEFVTTPIFIRFSEEGEFLWDRTPVIDPLVNMNINDVISAPGGGYLAAGEARSDSPDKYDDMLLLKVDEDGDPLWWRHFGAENTEWAENLLLAGTEQLLLWGYNQARPPLYDLQSVLAHTDLDGDVMVGIDPRPEVTSSNVTVFPNPARDVLHVLIHQAKLLEDIPWQLCDLTGRLIASGITDSPAFDIPLDHLHTGMYVLSFPQQAIPAKRVVVW